MRFRLPQLKIPSPLFRPFLSFGIVALAFLAIASIPSSSRATDFVKLGSPFANPTNLYSIASVFDRGPKVYEAWAVGEEVGTGKGVLAYYNGTFWANIALPSGVPALRGAAALRYLRTIDVCARALSAGTWTSIAWAVGDNGYILKLDQYTNSWKLMQRALGTGNPCPIGQEGTAACENWTTIDLKAVSQLNEAGAVAVGQNEAGGRNSPLQYADQFVNDPTSCVSSSKLGRRETWSVNADPDFTDTDDVRAITAIDDNHFWLAGVNNASGEGRIWKYTRQGYYERIRPGGAGSLPDQQVAALPYTSIAAVLQRSAGADNQPLRSLVWAASETGQILRYNERDDSSVEAPGGANDGVSVYNPTSQPIRSIAVARRAGGKDQNLALNSDFRADRRDGGNASNRPDGWSVSGLYKNGRGNIVESSFLDSGRPGAGKAFSGEPWQNISGYANQAYGQTVAVTHFLPYDWGYPHDFFGSVGGISYGTTFQDADQTTGMLQTYGAFFPPYEIGTLIKGYVKIPGNDVQKTYQFKVEQTNPVGRISLNIENDNPNDKECVRNGVRTGTACPMGTECAPGDQCLDLTMFPTISGYPWTENSVVRWTAGTCGNSTVERACFGASVPGSTSCGSSVGSPEELDCRSRGGSCYGDTGCFDDSECYWGTCSGDPLQRCRVDADCQRACNGNPAWSCLSDGDCPRICTDDGVTQCLDDGWCPSGAPGSCPPPVGGSCPLASTCQPWSTASPPLCQGASPPGTVETPLVTFPAYGGIRAQECTNFPGRSCTTDEQCNNVPNTCQIRGGGWYPFMVQYYQPWTPRCSNDPTKSCIYDYDCGSGFCQIGKWCQSGPKQDQPCFQDNDCSPGSHTCGTTSTFPVQYKGTCSGAPTVACRKNSDCVSNICYIETDPLAPLRFSMRENGVGPYSQVPATSLLEPNGPDMKSEIVQEIPGTLLPGVAYRVSGWYKTEFTDVFATTGSQIDPRLKSNPHAGIAITCKNNFRSAGRCGYDLNIFQTDLANGVTGQGRCKNNTAVLCQTNADCTAGGVGGVCGGEWTSFSAILTKQNRNSSGVRDADDPGQSLVISCYAEVGAKISCDDLTVTEENNAALTGFDVIDVWAVGDGGTIVRNTIDIASGVGADRWLTQKSASVSLTSINAPDAYHFWAVGESGGGERANLMRLSPGNVRGWAWIGASTDATKLDPLGWIDFNCGNRGTCLGQPSAFGVNVNDSTTYGVCENNPNRTCSPPGGFNLCGGRVLPGGGIYRFQCVAGVITGSAWIGTQDPNETVDFGTCENIKPGQCQYRHCTGDVTMRCNNDGPCAGIGDGTCASRQDCSSSAACVNTTTGQNDGTCNFNSVVNCGYPSYSCSGNSARKCEFAAGQCYGTCSKNEGLKCLEDSDCKVSCQTNPIACRSTGWLSFDKSITGTPPEAPYTSSDQGYLARFNAGTDTIDGWARIQFGRCVNSGNPSTSSNTGCYQDSQCIVVGETCDWSHAPSVPGGIAPADASTKAGWVKLRGGSIPGGPFGALYLECKDCGTGVDPNNPNDDTCKFCAAEGTGVPDVKSVACNDCSNCLQKRCNNPARDPCVDSSTCGGSFECKPSGICVTDGSYNVCFSNSDCGDNNCTAGAACSPCQTCDEYGVALDMSTSGRGSGFGWSPDVGWIDFSGINLGSQLFFQTLYGDIYSGGNVGSGSTATPPGYPGGTSGCNATYRIIAKGTITNFCSSAQTALPDISPLTSPFLRPSETLYPLPSRDNLYTSKIGDLDITGLTTIVDPSAAVKHNKYGNEVRCKNNDCTTPADAVLTDFFTGAPFTCGNPTTADDDRPLMGRVHYVNGNLTVSEDMTFDPPMNCDPDRSGAGTFVVEGNLYINANLSYLTTRGSGVSSLIQLPSVAFIVKGDIIVSSSVTNIKGAYYAEGTIRVESSLGTDQQLVVNGLMIAKGFDFQRKYRGGGGAPAPAEQVIYDGRLHANTPPGFSNIATSLPNVKEVLP